MMSCPFCKGKGTAVISYGNQFFEQNITDCPVCNGAKVIDAEEIGGEVFVKIPYSDYVNMKMDSDCGYEPVSDRTVEIINRMNYLIHKGYSICTIDEFQEADEAEKSKNSDNSIFDKIDDEYIDYADKFASM